MAEPEEIRRLVVLYARLWAKHVGVPSLEGCLYGEEAKNAWWSRSYAAVRDGLRRWNLSVSDCEALFEWFFTIGASKINYLAPCPNTALAMTPQFWAWKSKASWTIRQKGIHAALEAKHHDEQERG